jgi:hypothetical protein
VSGYRSWARARDRRLFAGPDLKGDWVAGRDEFSAAIARGELPDWLAGVEAADIQEHGTEAILDRTRTTTAVLLLVYLVALGLDVWLVFVLPRGSFYDHVGALLAIIGVFAFATGFFNAAEVVKQLPPFFLADLTSPNLFRFISGNLKLLALTSDFAVAYVYGRDPWSDVSSGWKLVLFPLSVIIFVVQTLIALSWFVVSFAYLVFVLPFTYLAYAAAGVTLMRIAQTDKEKVQTINPWRLEPHRIVASHMFELRVFSVGALASFAAALFTIIPLY